MKKTCVLRILLCVLIILNTWMIFGLSSESSEESSQLSRKVTAVLAEWTVRDFDQLSAEQQEAEIDRLHPTVRSLAHMTEFACLGGLWLLLLLTKKKATLFFRGGIAMIAVLLTAILDELLQKWAGKGRVADPADVLLDCLGGFLGCCAVLAVILLIRLYQKGRCSTMKITSYKIPCAKLQTPLRLALVSDIHDNPHGHILEALQRESPDLILVAGDLTDDEQINNGAAQALAFLSECAAIAKTYYSLGNHEVKCYHRGNPFRHPIPVPIPELYREAVAKTGAILLDNEILSDGQSLTVCGLSSGICGHENRPDPTLLEQLKKWEPHGDVKLLLCHHPEYYIPYLQEIHADLVVCGHAHGGHWRFFGRGVYAPGQGLFPRYTSGVIGKNCVISRGLGDHTKIPRIFNPRELVMITLGGEE
ncbi:MAG: hypothetical protein E7620_08700 [Ruminococcaceae bacterium]|nr:hypothetical protein [Oscillospiraceae bacterium]